MNQLQAELATEHPELDIQIVGINQIGHESANALMTEGRNLPWLQDVDSNNNQLSDVWTEQWNVTYRDVTIVDADNTELGAFNLTTYNLADAGTYKALREILIDVAADQPFWQNRDNSLDVNKDGFVSAQGDVLPGINELNNHFLTSNGGQLPALRLPPNVESAYLDVNGDGILSAQADILPLINFLNNGGSGEGEFSNAGSFDVSAHLSQVDANSVLRTNTLATPAPAMGTTPVVLVQTRGAGLDASADRRDRGVQWLPHAETEPLIDVGTEEHDEALRRAIDSTERSEWHPLGLEDPISKHLDNLDELAADVAGVWSW